MKISIYLTIIMAAIVTIVICLKTMSRPVSASALVFIMWAVSPYVYLSVMIKIVSKKVSIIAVFVLSVLIGGFGMWTFIDAMFIHTDAQGGLIFIVAPLWQWVVLLLVSLPIYYLNKAKKQIDIQI